MNKFGGWQRLGTVVSGVWILLVLLYVHSEYREVAAEHEKTLTLMPPPTGFVVEPLANPYFFAWQPVDLFATGPESYVRGYELKGLRFVAALVGPVVALWLIGFLTDWVRRGFALQKKRL